MGRVIVEVGEGVTDDVQVQKEKHSSSNMTCMEINNLLLDIS